MNKEEQKRLLEQQLQSVKLNQLIVRYETEIYRLESKEALSRCTHSMCLIVGFIAGAGVLTWLL